LREQLLDGLLLPNGQDMVALQHALQQTGLGDELTDQGAHQVLDPLERDHAQRRLVDAGHAGERCPGA